MPIKNTLHVTVGSYSNNDLYLVLKNENLNRIKETTITVVTSFSNYSLSHIIEIPISGFFPRLSQNLQN